MNEIRGINGSIYPYGYGQKLAVRIWRMGAAFKLQDLGLSPLYQDHPREGIYIFGPDLAFDVLNIIKAKKGEKRLKKMLEEVMTCQEDTKKSLV